MIKVSILEVARSHGLRCVRTNFSRIHALIPYALSVDCVRNSRRGQFRLADNFQAMNMSERID